MLTLKNIKIYTALTEETLAFSATMYWNDIKTGVVENTGKGGAHTYTFNKFRKEVQSWAEQQPTEYNFEKLDQIVNKIIDQFQEHKFLKNLCRNHIVFQCEGDEPTSWRNYKVIYRPEHSIQLRNKFPNIKIIANELFAIPLKIC